MLIADRSVLQFMYLLKKKSPCRKSPSTNFYESLGFSPICFANFWTAALLSDANDWVMLQLFPTWAPLSVFSRVAAFSLWGQHCLWLGIGEDASIIFSHFVPGFSNFLLVFPFKQSFVITVESNILGRLSAPQAIHSKFFLPISSLQPHALFSAEHSKPMLWKGGQPFCNSEILCPVPPYKKGHTTERYP